MTRTPDEAGRRRPGAAGTPVRLADGRPWLLAHPTFRPTAAGLTSPDVDGPLDRIFDCAVLGEEIGLADLFGAARALLLRNYDLDERELAELLSVSPGPEAAALAEAVVAAVLGGDAEPKGFTRWARASLLANGLAGVEIPARDLADVLAVLVATNRTVPLSRFADACRRLDERASLETLI